MIRSASTRSATHQDVSLPVLTNAWGHSRSVQSPQRGSYLLEFGVVTLGIAMAIVGIADVARIFHARGAIRAGVTEALRCLYPADPKCTSTTLSNALIPGARFNAWVWGSEGYMIPQTRYTIVSSIFQEPVLEIGYEATKLNSIDVSQPDSAFDRHAIQFPVDAHSPYLVMTRDLPMISGSDPLNPTFRDRYSGKRIEPNQTIAIQSIRKLAVRSVPNPQKGENEYSAGFEIGSQTVTFTDSWLTELKDASQMAAIREQYGVSVPCYQGPLVSGASSPRLEWPRTKQPRICSYRSTSGSESHLHLLSGENLSIPIMIRISGVSRATSASAQGKIVASLSWYDRGRQMTRQLGGRVFSSSGQANFVTRGADWNDINPDARLAYRERYRDEIELHGTLPLIPVRSAITVRLYLSSVNGQPVGWQGESLEVFYPRVQLVREVMACGFSEDPTVCASEPVGRPILYRDVGDSRMIRAVSKGGSVCSRKAPQSLETADSDVVARIQAAVRQGMKPAPYSFWVPGGGACPVRVNSYLCDDQFKDEMIGCREERSQEYILSRCNVLDYQPERDSIKEVRYDEEARSRLTHRGQCSDEPLPECAQPYVKEYGTRVLGASAAGCSAAINISPPPETTGALMDTVCVDLANVLRQRYRERTRLGAEGSLVVLSTPVEPLFSPKPPSDPCTPAEKILRGDTRRFLCARESSRWRAQQCCDTHEGRCVIEEFPPSDGIPAESVVEALLSSAEERAIESVRAIYPPTHGPNECVHGESNCLGVHATLERGNTVARVQAQLSVPLGMLSLFGKPDIVVEYDEERLLERAISSHMH